MPRGLEELLREREEERARAIERARAVAEELRKRLGRATIVLHGSYSRGDFNLWSDVDMLIVSERFEGVHPLKRLDLVLETLPPRFEAICLSPSEARAQLEKPWWREALKSAVFLVDDYGLSELRRARSRCGAE